MRIFTVVLCFQGLFFSLHWPDASFNSTLLRITCSVLSDISGFQTLPGGSRYRAWKWPWAKANHGWHCRANLCSSSSSSMIIQGNLLFCLWINEAQYARKEFGLGFHPALFLTHHANLDLESLHSHVFLPPKLYWSKIYLHLHFIIRMLKK